MKLKVLVTGVTLTAATLLGAVSAQSQDIEYRGDTRAAAICRAVAEDNPGEVKTQLRKAVRESRGNSVTTPSSASFQCNGKSLETFARDMGASKALTVLSDTHNQSVAQS